MLRMGQLIISSFGPSPKVTAEATLRSLGQTFFDFEKPALVGRTHSDTPGARPTGGIAPYGHQMCDGLCVRFAVSCCFVMFWRSWGFDKCPMFARFCLYVCACMFMCGLHPTRPGEPIPFEYLTGLRWFMVKAHSQSRSHLRPPPGDLREGGARGYRERETWEMLLAAGPELRSAWHISLRTFLCHPRDYWKTFYDKGIPQSNLYPTTHMWPATNSETADRSNKRPFSARCPDHQTRSRSKCGEAAMGPFSID